MVVVGLFSSYLTYLLLAVVYVFGYSAYALNCKKNDCSSTEPAPKVLAYEGTGTSIIQQDDCFYWSDDYCDTQLATESVSNIKYDFNLFKNIKAKEQCLTMFYNLKLSFKFTSRPPPFVA